MHKGNKDIVCVHCYDSICLCKYVCGNVNTYVGKIFQLFNGY